MTCGSFQNARNTSRFKWYGNYGRCLINQRDDRKMPPEVVTSSKPFSSSKDFAQYTQENPETLSSLSKTIPLNNAFAHDVLPFDSNSITLADNFSCRSFFDRGAAYSAKEIVGLFIVAHSAISNWNSQLNPLSSTLSNCLYWKYGSGKLSSPLRRIIGSVSLLFVLKYQTIISIRHLILDASRQWVISRIMTVRGNICQIRKPELIMADRDNSTNLLRFMVFTILLFLSH